VMALGLAILRAGFALTRGLGPPTINSRVPWPVLFFVLFFLLALLAQVALAFVVGAILRAGFARTGSKDLPHPSCQRAPGHGLVAHMAGTPRLISMSCFKTNPLASSVARDCSSARHFSRFGLASAVVAFWHPPQHGSNIIHAAVCHFGSGGSAECFSSPRTENP